MLAPVADASGSPRTPTSISNSFRWSGAAELQLHQEHVARLETRPPNVEGKGAVKQRQLLVNALRMRPDRIVVGETRGEEALDMLQAMNTGHDGSLTTVHANTPRDALSRIETMIAMGATNLPERAMRQQIAAAIQIVVQQSRMSDGTRKVTSISEITGMEGDVITMQEIFLFEKLGVTQDGKVIGRFRATGVRPEGLRAAEGVRHPPAARHVRRRDRGAVMAPFILVVSVFVFGTGVRARRCACGARKLPGYLAQKRLQTRLEELNAPDATGVGRRRRPGQGAPRRVRCRPSIGSSAASPRGFVARQLGRAVGRPDQRQRAAAGRSLGLRRGVRAFSPRRSPKMSIGWVIGGAVGAALPWIVYCGQADAAHAHVRGEVPRGARSACRAR